MSTVVTPLSGFAGTTWVGGFTFPYPDIHFHDTTGDIYAAALSLDTGDLPAMLCMVGITSGDTPFNGATATFGGLAATGTSVIAGGVNVSIGTAFSMMAFLFTWDASNPPADGDLIVTLDILPGFFGNIAIAQPFLFSGVDPDANANFNAGANAAAVNDFSSGPGATSVGPLPGVNGAQALAMYIAYGNGIGFPPTFSFPNDYQNSTNDSIIDGVTALGAVTSDGNFDATWSGAHGFYAGSTAMVVQIVPTPTVTVPDLTGLTQAAATTALTDAGLAAGVVSSLFSQAVPVGLVFLQAIAPGTIVAPGTAVGFTLSLGPQFAIVPDVRGDIVAEARSAITTAGLVTGTATGVVDPNTPIGNVATQFPAPGTLVPFGSSVDIGISFLTPDFDVDQTVISQYANSPTILALVEDFAQWFDPNQDLQDFYLAVWNIETAYGFGLDIWGIILGVSRVIPIPGTSGAFGFDNTDVPSDWENFGNRNNALAGGPFFSGQISTGSYRLDDGPYLTLLLTKALANICATTAPALNALITSLFPGRGRCYTQDLGGMEMAYFFNFALTSIELSILEFSGVLAHPAGVGVSINVVPEDLFGFKEAGTLSKPFNFGVFHHGT